MIKKPKFLASSLFAIAALSGSLYATDYTNTSYWVAYDGQDRTEYTLVMPSVQKVYTHKAGDIQNLIQIDNDFKSFPVYNNGELCFSEVSSGVEVGSKATIMAGKCYDVNFFYTQKETIPEGTAFMLSYPPTAMVMEGLAGDGESFQTVKKGDVISNENSITGADYSTYSFDVESASASVTPAEEVLKTKEDLSGSITSNMTLTSDKIWVLNGLVTVEDGAVLTIAPGTTIVGKAGTGAATSYMIVDKGSKIMAEGTESNPIIFTSETAYDGGAATVGQWGGLTIIGNAGNDQVEPYEVNPSFVAGTSDMADNSGVLKYVQILNSGITMEENKEINGLSMVGVGSGTTVENITVAKSDDDCVELWGGTVNLTNVDLSECTDDHFDIDDGYAGTVKNLKIVGTIGNAGIEMSGETAATFDGFDITMTTSEKEGGIYFKKDGIGGHFKNGTVTYNTPANGYGAIHSKGAFDDTATSFENVTLEGSNLDKFTGDSAQGIEAIFDAGANNSK